MFFDLLLEDYNEGFEYRTQFRIFIYSEKSLFEYY